MSSKTFAFCPSPIFHIYPILATHASHPNHFQNMTGMCASGERQWSQGVGRPSCVSPPPPPHRRRRGRSAPCGGETRGGVQRGRGSKSSAPRPQSNRIWTFLFFYPIESNPKLYKQVDIHIQPSPNPLKSMGQNPIGFGSSPIHSQE